MTKILANLNQLGDDGTITLCDALRESKISKVQELSLQGNKIGPKGAKASAALCAVKAMLTRPSESGRPPGGLLSQSIGAAAHNQTIRHDLRL